MAAAGARLQGDPHGSIRITSCGAISRTNMSSTSSRSTSSTARRCCANGSTIRAATPATWMPWRSRTSERGSMRRTGIGAMIDTLTVGLHWCRNRPVARPRRGGDWLKIVSIWRPFSRKADYRFLRGAIIAAHRAFMRLRRGASTILTEVQRATEMAKWLAERFRSSHRVWRGKRRLPHSKLATAFPRSARNHVRRAGARSGHWQHYPQEPRLFFYPGLPYIDFADVTQFAWRKELESRYRELRDEASALLADTSDFSPYVRRSSEYPQGDVYGLVENPSWSSLYLWNLGRARSMENVARCPRTFAGDDANCPAMRDW